MRGRFLRIPQRDVGVQGCGNERMPQRARPDALGAPGPAGHPPDDLRGAMPGPAARHRARRRLALSHRSPMARPRARAVRGASGIVTILPPCSGWSGRSGRARCPPTASMFASAARTPAGRSGPAGKTSACFTAGRARRPPAARRARCAPARPRAIRNPAGAADMSSHGMLQVFLHRLPVEPGDRAQPPGNRGTARPRASRSRANRHTRCRWHQLAYWRDPPHRPEHLLDGDDRGGRGRGSHWGTSRVRLRPRHSWAPARVPATKIHLTVSRLK